MRYLYYKLYKVAEKSSFPTIPSFMAGATLALLLFINVVTISAFLSKMDIFPFVFQGKLSRLSLILFFICLTIFLFVLKQKTPQIISRYSGETEKERIKGSFWVVTYITLSFILIAIIANFRPGKL